MRSNSLITRVLIWRIRHVSDRSFMMFLSVIIGIFAGLNASLLKSAVFFFRQILLNEVTFSFKNYLIFFYPAIGIALTVLFKKYIIKDNVTHSVTAVLYAISKQNSIVKAHKIYSSLLGAFLTAGFGGSIGLESPIISSGTSLGSNLGKALHLNYKTITVLLACGASGAMAAIFNTPIAAVVFAMEVLLLDLTRFSLIPLLMASTSGAITTKVLFNDDILFGFTITDAFATGDIPFFLIFALISGLLASYFTKVFLFLETVFDRIKKLEYRYLAGVVSLGILLFLFPPLFGEGFESIKIILSENYKNIFSNTFFHSYSNNTIFVIIFFSFLALLKVVATATTIGAGGIGGIFAPSLFTGAYAGFLFAFTINSLDIGIYLSESNFALIGMASMLSGVLHAPLTGLFLIAEITGGYHLILPLMLATTISFIISKALVNNSIFTQQLAKKGELLTHHKDKTVLKFMRLENIIENDFLPIAAEKTLGDLVKIVANSKRNIFPVLNSENEMAGIIILDDIRDIMFNTDNYNMEVQKLMHKPPDYIFTTDSMEMIMNKFKETNAWNLPVLENGKYKGFVSKSKMFSVYRKLLIDISAD